MFVCSNRPAIVSLHTSFTDALPSLPSFTTMESVSSSLSITTRLSCDVVNTPNIMSMAPFSTSIVPEAFFFSTDSSLLFGTIDSLHVLHVSTIKLGETPKKICVDENCAALVVATHREYPPLHRTTLPPDVLDLNLQDVSTRQHVTGDNNMRDEEHHQSSSSSSSHTDLLTDGVPFEQDYMHTIDYNTHQLSQSFTLHPNEEVLSLANIPLSVYIEEKEVSSSSRQSARKDSRTLPKTFALPPASFIVVGTAYVYPDEVEPQRGRLLVFRLLHDSLHLESVAAIDTAGGVFKVAEIGGNRIVAPINHHVAVYKLFHPLNSFEEEHTHSLLKQFLSPQDALNTQAMSAGEDPLCVQSLCQCPRSLSRCAQLRCRRR